MILFLTKKLFHEAKTSNFYRTKSNSSSKTLLNFRMWFKYELKAQKLLAQGIALGMIAISKTPCKGKSFMFCLEF